MDQPLDRLTEQFSKLLGNRINWSSLDPATLKNCIDRPEYTAIRLRDFIGHELAPRLELASEGEVPAINRFVVLDHFKNGNGRIQFTLPRGYFENDYAGWVENPVEATKFRQYRLLADSYDHRIQDDLIRPYEWTWGQVFWLINQPPGKSNKISLYSNILYVRGTRKDDPVIVEINNVCGSETEIRWNVRLLSGPGWCWGRDKRRTGTSILVPISST